MDTMLQGLQGVMCYLDDIIVMGKNRKEHLQNLEVVLQHVQDYGFWLHKEKCFLQDSVEYLAHIISKNGIQPLPLKIEAIVKMPAPNNKFVPFYA